MYNAESGEAIGQQSCARHILGNQKMKKAVKLFVIGLLTILFSFNVSMSFSQSKEKTIKKGSVFICNVDGPKQGAYAGRPIWVFGTLNYIFEDGGKVFKNFEACMYTINTRNGGLGDAIVAKASETSQDTYQVKDGNVYIWGSADAEQIADSAYLILAIEDEEHLTPIKTTEDAFVSSHFVYLGNMKEIKKMSDAAKDQVERDALSIVLSLRNQETYLMAEREKQERLKREEEERLWREEQERRKREEQERRKREADSIAHVRELENTYSSCRFLFNSDSKFVSCITSKQQSEIDLTIEQLISDKLDIYSAFVQKGKELYKNRYDCLGMINICNMCCSKQTPQNIVSFTENKLESFVSERKALTKAYNKAKKKNQNIKCSAFLIDYIQENLK